MQRLEKCKSYENCYCTIPTESSYCKDIIDCEFKKVLEENEELKDLLRKSSGLARNCQMYHYNNPYSKQDALNDLVKLLDNAVKALEREKTPDAK
jgi:hypothetical protein